MSYLIKRTTEFDGEPTVFYFVRPSGMGPMFNLRSSATVYETREEAEEIIEEHLSSVSGQIEIVEI